MIMSDSLWMIFALPPGYPRSASTWKSQESRYIRVKESIKLGGSRTIEKKKDIQKFIFRNTVSIKSEFVQWGEEWKKCTSEKKAPVVALNHKMIPPLNVKVASSIATFTRVVIGEFDM